LVQAYSPIAHGTILDNPTLVRTAESYGVSVPQLCIRYVLQLATQAPPKTANPEHMRANAQVDFEISDPDMHALLNGEHSYLPAYSGK
jgi:diketogulonate reductase-like aldo/keto reductase